MSLRNVWAASGGELGRERGEFVAADAVDVVFAERCGELARGRLQEAVAFGVAARVVRVLEPVDVSHEEQRALRRNPVAVFARQEIRIVAADLRHFVIQAELFQTVRLDLFVVDAAVDAVEPIVNGAHKSCASLVAAGRAIDMARSFVVFVQAVVNGVRFFP